MNKQIPLIAIDTVSDPEGTTSLASHGGEVNTQKIVSQSLYASRKKIYVRKITGFFQKIRAYSLTILLLMYFTFCWFTVGGEPLILFDIDARKFHLFGAIFWPQDFTLLAFALIISAFGLFFITSLFGRVWCGYSCPQTVWSFMFIWLEEFFEGSRNQRIKSDKSGLNLQKLLRKTAKHLSWLLLALATGITFVGYFIPVRELIADIGSLSLTSSWAIFWIIFFTAATYINAGWLREQVCIYMCPYARFQSVMFNENTLIVGYDKQRGEPRGSRSRQEIKSGLGDCVDCQLCVQVCPTGIDIRDGLQYECIGCALCIDACDSIMKKLNYSTGLIRYASEKEFETGKPQRKFDAKTIAYAALVILSVSIFTLLLIQRPLLELSVMRERGALYQENGMGLIENFYLLKVINKKERAEKYILYIENIDASLASKNLLKVGPGEVKNFPISVVMDPTNISEPAMEIRFKLQEVNQEHASVTVNSKFLGPINDW